MKTTTLGQNNNYNEGSYVVVAGGFGGLLVQTLFIK